MKKDRLSVRFSSELISDLKLISTLEGCSISFIIRTILQDYVNYYMWKGKPESKNSTEINGERNV